MMMMMSRPQSSDDDGSAHPRRKISQHDSPEVHSSAAYPQPSDAQTSESHRSAGDSSRRQEVKSIPYDDTTVANQPRQTTTVGHELPVASPGVGFPVAIDIYDRTHFRWHPKVYLARRMREPLYYISHHRKG